MQLISKKNFIFIVCGLFMIGAGIYAAQWKWHFWQSAPQTPSSALVEPQPIESGQDVAQLPNNAPGVRDVLAAQLFGQQEDTAKKVVVNPAEAPKTQQPLELHGIVFIPHHPERAVAIIAQVGGMAKDYKTGDMLEPLPGWKVLEILPDAVRIGQEEPGEILPLSAANAGQSGNAPAGMMNLDNNAAPLPEEAMPPSQEEIPPTQDELLPPDESQIPVQEEAAPPAVDPGATAPAPAPTPRVG